MSSSPATLPRSSVVVITVTPIGRGRFDATVGTTPLVAGSREPFLDAARALVRNGLDPAAVLVMRHVGSADDAIRGRIRTAALYTVDESRTPRLRRWKGISRGDVPPPVRSHRRLHLGIAPVATPLPRGRS